MDRSTFLAQLHGRYELPASAIDALVEYATGERVAEVQRLVRGDENEVHRVRLGNGGVVFVRACFPDTPPGKASGEADVMQMASAAGVPVPAVLSVQTLRTEQGDRQAMVLAEAAGIQLSEALPMLSATERATVMRSLGHLLGLLATVRMPGHGKPDRCGQWPDPEKDRLRYLAAVRADSKQLDQAGFADTEIAQIGRRIDDITGVADPPILCHCDISAEHLFIDAEQNVTGLIDWGMWSGGSFAEELAALSTNLDDHDFATVLAHHPYASHDRADLQRKLAASILTRSIGGLAWLIRSGQSDRRARLASAIRRAVEDLRPQ